MKEALRYAGVIAGDKVLLPSFICRDLLSCVAELGAETIFYNVNQKLEPVDLDSTVMAKVVVAVNYFGFPQNLEPFQKYSQLTNAKIIEDNAHGFLSRDDEKILLGSRTNFGITSFRKSLRVQDGAILTTSLSDLEIDKQLVQLDVRQSSRSKVLAAIANLETNSKIPLTLIGQLVSRTLRFLKSGSTLPRPDPSAEMIIPIPANPHKESIKRLQAVDEIQEVKRRRELYKKLAPKAVATGAKLIFDELPQNTCPYGVPVFATDHQRTKLAKVARKNRVTLMRWPELPMGVVETAPDFYHQVCLLNFR